MWFRLIPLRMRSPFACNHHVRIFSAFAVVFSRKSMLHRSFWINGIPPKNSKMLWMKWSKILVRQASISPHNLNTGFSDCRNIMIQYYLFCFKYFVKEIIPQGRIFNVKIWRSLMSQCSFFAGSIMTLLTWHSRCMLFDTNAEMMMYRYVTGHNLLQEGDRSWMSLEFRRDLSVTWHMWRMILLKDVRWSILKFVVVQFIGQEQNDRYLELHKKEMSNGIDEIQWDEAR